MGKLSLLSVFLSKSFWTQCFLQVVVTGDQWRRFLCPWFCSRVLSNSHHQILINTNQRPWPVVETPMSWSNLKFCCLAPAATWKMDILCSLKKQLQVRQRCQGKGVEKSVKKMLKRGFGAGSCLAGFLPSTTHTGCRLVSHNAAVTGREKWDSRQYSFSYIYVSFV